MEKFHPLDRLSVINIPWRYSSYFSLSILSAFRTFISSIYDFILFYFILFYYITHLLLAWLGQRSRYSDSLQAGRSGDRTPVEARFSALVGPRAHPASCTKSTVSYTGIKRLGQGAKHWPPSSSEVKERVEFYLYSPSGLSWPVVRRNLPLRYSSVIV